MRKTATRKYRKILWAKYAEIVRDLQAKNRLASVDAGGDLIDRFQARNSRDCVARVLDLESNVLDQVQGALREIDAGTFGVCNSCGREIPARRLEAVPWSPYCVACQERFEELESRGTAA